MRRYDTEKSTDGLPAGEEMFPACHLWLVDAYLMIGRRDDAVRLFERLLSLRNYLGLPERTVWAAHAPVGEGLSSGLFTPRTGELRATSPMIASQPRSVHGTKSWRTNIWPLRSGRSIDVQRWSRQSIIFLARRGLGPVDFNFSKPNLFFV